MTTQYHSLPGTRSGCCDASCITNGTDVVCLGCSQVLPQQLIRTPQTGRSVAVKPIDRLPTPLSPLLAKQRKARTTQKKAKGIPPVLEKDFQKAVIDLAQLLNYKCAHFRAVKITRKDGSVYHATPVAADGEGWPDLVMVGNGRVIYAELKSEKGVVSKGQEDWLRGLEDAGVECYTWRPSMWEELKGILERKV